MALQQLVDRWHPHQDHSEQDIAAHQSKQIIKKSVPKRVDRWHPHKDHSERDTTVLVLQIRAIFERILI
jgi:hypothetical protein